MFIFHPSYYSFSWLSFTEKHLKTISPYLISLLSPILATPKSILICSIKTLLVDMTNNLDLDKSFSSIRCNCHALLLYFLPLAFRTLHTFFFLIPFLLLLSLFAFSSYLFYYQVLENPRAPFFTPLLFSVNICLCVSVCVLELGILLQFHSLKYHLFAFDSQVLIFSSNPFPNFILVHPTAYSAFPT